MEPEVHIIEKHFQVVLGCLTMANIKCNRANKEIDLLAMNPKTQERFHVESRVTRTGFKIIKHDTTVKKGRWKDKTLPPNPSPLFHKCSARIARVACMSRARFLTRLIFKIARFSLGISTDMKSLLIIRTSGDISSSRSEHSKRALEPKRICYSLSSIS